jgi:hypothetical protein
VQLHGAFGTWHYGAPEYFIAQHQKLDIVVCSVANGYYALLAVTERDGSAPLALALANLRAAALALRVEIT